MKSHVFAIAVAASAIASGGTAKAICTTMQHEFNDHAIVVSDEQVWPCGVDPIWWTVWLRCLLHGMDEFEFDRTVVVDRRVAALKIVEAVDVFAN